MPCDLWRWNIDVDHVADLSRGEQLASFGHAPATHRQDWPGFQAVGEEV
jgi:hypothetical protein